VTPRDGECIRPTRAWAGTFAGGSRRTACTDA